VDLDVRNLCRMLRQRGGSDLHLVTGEAPFIRLHGEVEPLAGMPVLSREQVTDMMRQITVEQNLQRLNTFGEWDGAITLDDERYRLNFMFVDAGSGDGREPAISVRALDANARSPQSLGIPEEVVALCTKPHGLVLVTGPTGSGKSTTLASLIDHINRTRACTILTIEDPIEFVHRSKKALVRQREVGRDTRSFQEAIKHALRQDPDVILVGEMRDLETIEAAITLAETGHLVFATLHTPNAPGALERIIQVFPAAQHNQIQTQLSLALRGVIAQRLVPVKSGDGRVAAFEVLLDDTSIRSNIREGNTSQLIQYMTPAKGMGTMERSLAKLVRGGIITEDVAVAYCERVEDLHDLLQDSVVLDASASSGGSQRFGMRGKR
jgi:twitching motility protein PilT